MTKPQKWKNIKKLPEKNTKKEVQEKISPSPLELWVRQIDKNVEFLYEEINQRELSNTETEQKIGDLKRRINLLSIQIDCLIWRSWKIGEELQALEKGKKSRIAMHKDEYYVLRIKEKNLTLLVHELSHIVDFLEKHLQIEDSSWEFKAYILDWLFDEISKKFKGKKSYPLEGSLFWPYTLR